ncbi:MAG: alpha/beta fold hydrolase [Spartobacteria bacterium]|nr:alpha/beta fold hydrolase [Spartobacteria bacterium]
MPFVQANGINLYYEELGEGTPLVCIAGLGATRETWGLLRDNLAEHYRVIVFDNRGIGDTDAPAGPYSIEQMADDTIGLMDALEIPSAHLIGHSMGSSIAQNIAFRRPERVKKLILCNTYEKIGKKAEFVFKNNAFLLRKGVSEPDLFRVIMPWLFSEKFFQNAEMTENFIKTAENTPSKQSVDAFEHQITAACDFDGKNQLPDLKMPVLIISGAEDVLTPPENAEKMAKTIKNSTYRLIPTAHFSPIEAPSDVLDQMLLFLSM